MSAIRVLVVDDQAAVREGLVSLVSLIEGVEVVGAAATGVEALDLVARLIPDVVLMDLNMPVLGGVEATRGIRAKHPATRVVVLTTHADEASILDALRAGAVGYLTKDSGIAAISSAIVAAASGQSVLDPRVRERLLAVTERSPGRVTTGGRELPDELTPREVEVLSLIADGLSNGQIAARLVVSEATVKTHINRVFAKTGSRDRAQAVRYAYRHGLSGSG